MEWQVNREHEETLRMEMRKFGTRYTVVSEQMGCNFLMRNDNTGYLMETYINTNALL